MRKIFYLLSGGLILDGTCYAQTAPSSTLTAKDSTNIMIQLMTLLYNSDRATSYFFTNIGVGNRLFSVKI